MKLNNPAGLCRCPLSPCFYSHHGLDPQDSADMGVGSPDNVTSLLHPATTPPTSSNNTQHVRFGEAVLDKTGEESRRHSKTELKASVWIPWVPWRQWMFCSRKDYNWVTAKHEGTLKLELQGKTTCKCSWPRGHVRDRRNYRCVGVSRSHIFCK